jgi:hypothetical protein
MKLDPVRRMAADHRADVARAKVKLRKASRTGTAFAGDAFLEYLEAKRGPQTEFERMVSEAHLSMMLYGRAVVDAEAMTQAALRHYSAEDRMRESLHQVQDTVTLG